MNDERVDEFLAHHGIQGMKWGVSNGPPYPLSASEHKKVIDKAKNAASKAGSVVKKAGSGTVKAAKTVRQKINQKKEEKENKEREEEIRSLKPGTTKDLSKYSDEELSRIANRLQTQQRIADIDKAASAKGQSLVAKVLTKTANDAASDLATAAATTVVERLLGKVTGTKTSMIQEEFSRIRKSSRSGERKYTESEVAKAVEKALKEQE